MMRHLALSITFGLALIAISLTPTNAYTRPDAVSIAALPPTPPCGTMLSGTIIDAMESLGDWSWSGEHVPAPPNLTVVPGFTGQALQLSYDLGAEPAGFDQNPDAFAHPYAQMRLEFATPRDWSAGDHLRFIYRGTTPNTIEIGITSADNNQNYFASSWNEATHVGWWTYATWDFKDFMLNGQPFPDFHQVKAIFISVVATTARSAFGSGTFTVDQLQIVNAASRSVPPGFETTSINQTVLDNAAAWIAARQQPSGLLDSWPEEGARYAWLYDQALALIVLSHTDLDRARQLVDRLRLLQNGDGSWYFGYFYRTNTSTSTTPAIDTKKDIGPIAWLVYALIRYYFLESDPAKANLAYQDARQGAAWLATQQKPDGSLNPFITEWNLDAWWAFQATGYQTQADRLRDYLLNQAWDDQMGRFKSGTERYQIFLDNQTWGAAFLRAIGRPEDARRALSYARDMLLTTSSDGNVCGYDGAGPFSVWNEGTLQFIDQGGPDSIDLTAEVIGQLALDGSLQNSPEPVTPPAPPARPEFSAYIVWLSRWKGIAPTAWLYFAGTDEPFTLVPPAAPGAAPTRNHFTTSTPALTWNRVTWAAQYEIQVDSSPSFTVPLDYTTTVPATTLLVTPPLSDGSYYWRVRARNGSTVGAWSVVERFTIDAP